MKNTISTNIQARKTWLRKELRKWNPITRGWSRRDFLVHIIELEAENQQMREFNTMVSDVLNTAKV